MKSIKTYLLLFFTAIGTITQAQSYNNFYGDIVNNYSSDTVLNHLVEFENLGVKQHGSPALQNTLDWLIDKYTSYGYTNIEIDTFNYSAQDDYNLLVTKQGNLYPNTYVIIDGHYDTRSGPGTNDNGSGIAVILEVARLLQNINTDYSIKFINFSGEEDGLIGSTHYVNSVVVPTNMDIKIVFNIDEVGGVNGLTNDIIVCERDQGSPTIANAASYAYTDTLANCIELYANLQAEISYAYSSDYMPFQAQEKVITGLFEKNQSPHPHTPTDFLSNMDPNYVYEITKGTIGASLYFASAREFPAGTKDPSHNNDFYPSIYPNPVQNNLNIDFKKLSYEKQNIRITNILGEVIFEQVATQGKEKISLSSLNSGVYNLSIQSPDNYFSKKIIIQ